MGLNTVKSYIPVYLHIKTTVNTKFMLQPRVAFQELSSHVTMVCLQKYVD